MSILFGSTFWFEILIQINGFEKKYSKCKVSLSIEYLLQLSLAYYSLLFP